MVLDNGERWTPEPFQCDFAADLFAGVPELWLVVPEGNGKTTLLSGLALYHGDYTEDAAVLMAASSRDQCGLLLSQAIGFVRRSPGFAKRFRTYEGYRRIDCLRTAGQIQVFAADDRTGDGVIPTLALLDELHRHRSLRLYRTWRGKLGKRGGQLAAISTAGEPGSEFEITRERARTEAPDIQADGRHVRAAGREMILHDYALRAEDDPEDLEVVKEANPFSGITVETLGRKLASPTMTSIHWRRFVCNVPTRTEAAAIGEAEWLVREDDGPPDGAGCDVGLDLGWKWDATAIVPLFLGDWTPEGGEDGQCFLLGASSVITPPRNGNSLRPERIQAAFEDLHGRHPISRVVMDPSAGGEQLASWLETDLGVQVVAHSQKTAPMALAAARFMEALRGDRLRHTQDPDLTRHVLNAVLKELPDGAVKFVRPAESRASDEEAPRREIDALIAAAMVYSVAAGGRVYDGPLMEIL
jgi:phage terminase large subunit-like protein